MLSDAGSFQSAAKRPRGFSIAKLGLVLTLTLIAFFVFWRYRPVKSDEITRYTFVVSDVMVQVAKGTRVTMWTYNGQVPGPTIHAKVGDTIEITLINKTKQTHSLHSHGLDYAPKDDGSIAVPESMVPPGGKHVYVFKASKPGLSYYHDHAEDDQPVSVHQQQGLYGAVIVDDPNKPLPKVDKEEVVFFGEVYGSPGIAMDHGCAYCTFNEKYFTVDARTYPLSAQFHPLKAKVGQRLRFYVINIGNDIHSWHLHRQPQYLIERGGQDEVLQKRVESQVVGLVPGEAATIDAVMEEAGTWLNHCHVVPHADMGMISVLIVEP